MGLTELTKQSFLFLNIPSKIKPSNFQAKTSHGQCAQLFLREQIGIAFTEASYSNHISAPFKKHFLVKLTTNGLCKCVIDYFLSLPESADCTLHESLAKPIKYSVRTQKSHDDERPLSEKKSRAIGCLASMASRKMENNKIKIVSDEDDDRFLESLPANGELVPLVARDGTLASHHCGTGLTPSPGVICGLSLLLVLVLAPRGFPPGTSVFPSPQKPTFVNSNLIRTQWIKSHHVDVPLLIPTLNFFIFVFSRLQFNDQ